MRCGSIALSALYVELSDIEELLAERGLDISISDR
jgi:hypothetical protein